MRFSLLRPYQRFWEDVEEWLDHWAEVGLSLRQMQGELSASLATPIGLRALNERLNRIKQPVMAPLTSVPPVVLRMLSG